MNQKLKECIKEGKAKKRITGSEGALYDCLFTKKCRYQLPFGGEYFCRLSPLFEEKYKGDENV